MYTIIKDRIGVLNFQIQPRSESHSYIQKLVEPYLYTFSHQESRNLIKNHKITQFWPFRLAFMEYIDKPCQTSKPNTFIQSDLLPCLHTLSLMFET